MYLEQAGKLGGLEKLRLDRLEKLFFIDHESSPPATPVILPGFDEMEFSNGYGVLYYFFEPKREVYVLLDFELAGGGGNGRNSNWMQGSPFMARSEPLAASGAAFQSRGGQCSDKAMRPILREMYRIDPGASPSHSSWLRTVRSLYDAIDFGGRYIPEFTAAGQLSEIADCSLLHAFVITDRSLDNRFTRSVYAGELASRIAMAHACRPGMISTFLSVTSAMRCEDRLDDANSLLVKLMYEGGFIIRSACKEKDSPPSNNVMLNCIKMDGHYLGAKSTSLPYTIGELTMSVAIVLFQSILSENWKGSIGAQKRLPDRPKLSVLRQFSALADFIVTTEQIVDLRNKNMDRQYAARRSSESVEQFREETTTYFEVSTRCVGIAMGRSLNPSMSPTDRVHIPLTNSKAFEGLSRRALELLQIILKTGQP